MPRRDAFSMLRGSSSPAPESDITPSKPAAPSLEPPAIKPLDFIPAAEPRKKRERTWEKTHQGQVATYRGVPTEMHQTILHLAESLGVPIDEVARAFLEYTLDPNPLIRQGLILGQAQDALSDVPGADAIQKITAAR